MSIVRRDSPSRSIYRPIEDQFGRLLENMFEDFFSPMTAFSPSSRGGADDTMNPHLNVVETDKTFEVEAELPGVKREDIKVAIDNRRVTIEAEAKRETAEKEGEHVVYAERSSRKYARSFMLPTDVDDAASNAKLENGILRLTLPKKELAQVKKLTIQ